MEHKCERCHYTTDRLANLKRHLTKTRICDEVYSNISREDILREYSKNKSYACKKCGKGFTTCQSRWRHQKSCKTTQGNIMVPQDSQAVLEMIKGLQDEIMTLRQGNSSNSHNTNCNNVVTTNNIQINAFRQEDVRHLLEDRGFMDRVLKRREKGVLDLIRATYFDRKEHPENATVKLTNYKMPYIDTFDGQRWMKCEKEEVLEDMLDSSCTRLDDHYEDCWKDDDALLEEFSTTFKELIHEFMARVKDRDQYKAFFDALKKRIHLLIINESKVTS